MSAQKPSWIQGPPPSDTEVAWLLIGEPEEVKKVVLGVFVEDEGWCESGDWRGKSYRDQITDLIICWQPYHIPGLT